MASTSASAQNISFLQYVRNSIGTGETTKIGSDLYDKKYSKPYVSQDTYGFITYDASKFLIPSSSNQKTSMLSERMIRDASSGGFMFKFNERGDKIRETEKNKKTRISISPREKFIPGWLMDVNQIFDSGVANGMEFDEGFVFKVIDQVLVNSPTDYKKQDKKAVLAEWKTAYFDVIDKWIQTSFGRENPPDIFSYNFKTFNEKKIPLSPTEDEFLKILYRSIDSNSKSMEKVSKFILSIESNYALFRHAGSSSERSIADITDLIIKTIIYNIPKEDLDDDETRESIREVVTYLAINYITIRRYLNYYCLKNDAISNKVLYFLIRYWVDGDDKALKAILEREEQLMPLSDSQLRQIISSFRRLEAVIIEDKKEIEQKIYPNGGKIMNPWIESVNSTGVEIIQLRPEIAGLLFRNAMNHVIRFFLEPTPYFLRKWQQDEFVLGGAEIYRIKLHTQIRTLYSSTSPYAYDKLVMFLKELGTDSVISNTLSINKDPQTSSNNFVNNTTPIQEGASINTEDPPAISHSSDDVREFNKEILSNNVVVIPETSLPTTSTTTTTTTGVDECLSIILQLDDRNRLEKLGNINKNDLCTMVKKLYGDKSNQLTSEEFEFVLRYALPNRSTYVVIEKTLKISNNNSLSTSGLKNKGNVIITPFQDTNGIFGFIARKKERRKTSTRIYYTGKEDQLTWGRTIFESNSPNLPASSNKLVHTMYVVLYAQQIISSANLVDAPSGFDKTLFSKSEEKNFKLARELILTRIYALDVYTEKSEDTRNRLEQIRNTLG